MTRRKTREEEEEHRILGGRRRRKRGTRERERRQDEQEKGGGRGDGNMGNEIREERACVVVVCQRGTENNTVHFAAINASIAQHAQHVPSRDIHFVSEAEIIEAGTSKDTSTVKGNNANACTELLLLLSAAPLTSKRLQKLTSNALHKNGIVVIRQLLELDTNMDEQSCAGATRAACEEMRYEKM